MALKDAIGSETGCKDELNDNGLKEYFADGAYIRELFIPADMIVVSKLWNRERFWIITEGDVTFTTELGSQRVKAPYFNMAPFGTKVALYTHSDTRWFAITGADSTNNEDVEKEVMAKDYSECVYPWDLIKNDEENKQ